MPRCTLELRFDRPDRVYRVDQAIEGTVEVRVDAPCDARGLTLVCGWTTDGDGDRASGGRMDLRLAAQARWLPGSPVSYPFSLPAPAGPLTYEGERLQVRWHLQASADVPWRSDPKATAEFRLVAGTDPDAVDLGPDFAPPTPGGRPVIDLPGNVSHYPRLALAVGAGLAIVGTLGLLGQVGGLMVGYADWFWIIVSTVMVATGGTLLFLLFRHRFAEVKLGPVQVEFATREVHAGETLRCRVRFRPVAPVDLEGADLILIAREVVTGTVHRGAQSRLKRVTKAHVAVHRTIVLSRPRGVRAGEVVALDGVMVVPADAPPTFMALDNELRWAARVRLHLARWPDWLLEYPITMRPASVSRESPKRGDLSRAGGV